MFFLLNLEVSYQLFTFLVIRKWNYLTIANFRFSFKPIIQRGNHEHLSSNPSKRPYKVLHKYGVATVKHPFITECFRKLQSK